jgi:hypothetical protein
MKPRAARRALAALAVAGCCGSWAAAPLAATLTVAPGQSLAQALQRAADGDVIELLAGVHEGQVGVILQRRLTLRGVGGRTVLQAAGRSAEHKAILVVRDGDVRIENIEFRGARVADGNGAGIRFERGRLWVQGCRFIDNQNGILTGNTADAELTVLDSEFAAAPEGSRLPHLLYVGRIARFLIRGSHLRGGRQGHLLKSRALHNQVLYNRLDDRPDGQASYELEFPNGGLAWVVGNLIAQSSRTSNPTLLAFGAEGSPAGEGRAHGLYLAHNTFVNAGLAPALFVRVHEQVLAAPVTQRSVNNLYVGLGVADLSAGGVAQGNFSVPQAALQDNERGELRLPAGSWLHGRAVPAGDALGVPMQPVAEFAAPLGIKPLAPRATWSPGAYQD